MNRFLVALSGLVLGACPDTDTRSDNATNEPQVLEVELTDNAEIEKFDLNGDGKADVWKYFSTESAKNVAATERKRLLAKKDLDANFDGKIDIQQTYADDGALVREMMDLDFDGRLDVTDYYRGPEMIRREYKMNFVDKVDMWKHYEGGKLVRKERDTNGDGKKDLFEYFDKGKLKRVGYDRDGDEKPDDYDEKPGKAG
jgi:hypothetical protein